jgi:hypothetical protein
MPKTLLAPLAQIGSSVPSDWSTATDEQKTSIQSGLHELLLDSGCKCNGERLGGNSVSTTVRERIRALAITRRVDSSIRELAASRGVDVDQASAAEITVASSPDEINALIALESLISPAAIDLVVTNDEMAVIEREELARCPDIRDPDWSRDLAQFVLRATPHLIFHRDAITDLSVAKTVGFNLAALRAEVDNNGEVCAWICEEPVLES